jgi:mono/diheme cytochrome c family protein
MKCSACLVLLFFTAMPQIASAQPAALNAQQQLGQQLVSQSCGVCHLKPQITAATFGPPLSKESAGGSEDVMRQVIMDGTPRMPGFKVKFDSSQIDAIIAYLTTVPAPPPAAPAAPAR